MGGVREIGRVRDEGEGEGGEGGQGVGGER